MRFSLSLLFIPVLISSPDSLQARTWQVVPNGSGDAPTIQAAIDSAADGDVVELADGTYTGEGNRDIQYHGKAIEVRSASDNPDNCVIDVNASAGNFHRGFYIAGGEGAASVLKGVKVTNGYVVTRGGGMQIIGSSPTIRNCVLESNQAIFGAGFSIESSSPTIEDCRFINNNAFNGQGGGGACIDFSAGEFSDCLFENNVASGTGGGLFLQQAAPTITDCNFLGNTANGAGGINLQSSSDVHFLRCVIADNHATSNMGGIQCLSSDPLFEHCLITRNTSPGQAGIGVGSGNTILRNCTISFNSSDNNTAGVYIQGATSPTIIENCIISHSPQGQAIHCVSAVPPDITCTNIFGNAGGDWTGCAASLDTLEGNFSADPLFCDADGDDFTLHADSPCAPGNHPDGALCDLIGALDVDCGPTTSVEETSWGAVKNLWR